MIRFSFNQPRLAEAQVTRYVLREHRKGRLLRDVFSDRYVRNRCSNDQLHRMLDDPDVVHAIGDDDIELIRRDLIL